jgi:hypothetical protein
VPYFKTNSTRRFFALPASSALLAAGGTGPTSNIATLNANGDFDTPRSNTLFQFLFTCAHGLLLGTKSRESPNNFSRSLSSSCESSFVASFNTLTADVLSLARLSQLTVLAKGNPLILLRAGSKGLHYKTNVKQSPEHGIVFSGAVAPAGSAGAV